MRNFEQSIGLDIQNVTQLRATDVYNLKKGDVCLVRSSNVPQLGDHFILVVGGLIQKPHGLRPDTIGMGAPKAGKLLDQYTPDKGIVLLKLNQGATKAFYHFHHIDVAIEKLLKAA